MFKTFTSALIVASVNAADLKPAVLEPELHDDPTPFPTKAVVNFAVGIGFGFLNDNSLPEIKTCYKASAEQYPHLQKAVADVVAGHTKDAITELKALAAAMPAVIDTCKKITDDEAALVKWGEQFSDLPTAEKIVEKNFLANHKAIMADLDTAETDFKAKTYFKSGNDVADIVVKAMGPVVPSGTVTPIMPPTGDFPTEQLVNFLAGVAYDFMEENNLPEVKACYASAMGNYPNLEEAVKDLFAGHTKDAIAAMKKFAAAMSGVITTCTATKEDQAALAKFFSQFSDLPTAEKILEKNFLKHHKDIMTNLDAAETDWKADHWFKSGNDAGKIAVLALGPVVPSAEILFI